MINIVIATKAEADLIADMSRKTFSDTFAAFNDPENMSRFMNEKFNHEILTAEVGAPGNHFLLAYDEQVPVGYARVRDNNTPPGLEGQETIEIARLYAVKESIGKGVGKKLMQTCLDLGRTLNKKIAWLGVWEHNDRAIKFYDKWGFTRFSQHEFILGSDVQTDFLYKKEL